VTLAQYLEYICRLHYRQITVKDRKSPTLARNIDDRFQHLPEADHSPLDDRTGAISIVKCQLVSGPTERKV
jgi:hypothetical protein